MILAALAFALSLCAEAPAVDEPPPWGAGASAGEDLEIGLVVFGPGRDITGWFGHAALVVKDKRAKKSRLYNYGEFSFDELMLAKYALGHLEFWVGERAVDRTLDTYRREGRTVRTLELALTPSERLAVARFLADNVLPENKHYLYDHYTDNCATKPRDVLDRALGGRIKAASHDARMTLREHTLRHTSVFMPLAWVIDFLLNDIVDRPLTTWEEAFLPSELERTLRSLDLVAREVVHHAEGAVAREDVPSMTPWLLMVGVLCAFMSLAIVVRGRGARVLAAWTAVSAGLLGIPGTALFVMWGFTDHFITYRNENILLSSPLTLLAAPLALCAFMKGARGERAIRMSRALWTGLAGAVVVALAIQVLPWFTQANAAHLALYVPAVLGQAIAWRLVRPTVRLANTATPASPASPTSREDASTASTPASTA